MDLPAAFASRYGKPVIRRVSTEIFSRTYFTHCLACNFCKDQCCSYGVDVDLATHANILKHADGLEKFSGISRDQWFHQRITKDDDLPGGGAMRTRVRNGRCVFLNRSGRGCTIHSWAIAEGIDYHEVKSIVDCLFPVTWDGDLLCASEEVTDNSLACLDSGPSLYRGSRDEIAWYFGEDCVAALDAIERSVKAGREAA